MHLWYRLPLVGGSNEGRRAEERMGTDVMQTRESLADVAKGCVLRMVENEKGGGVEKESGIVCLQAHYSTLQCSPREREKAQHDWLAESEQVRQGVCSPTSNWVSTLLFLLHLNSAANSIWKQSFSWELFRSQLIKEISKKQENLTLLLEFGVKVWETELMNVPVKMWRGWISVRIWVMWTNLFVQIPQLPSVRPFLWQVWVALKQKMAFNAVVWQRSSGGKLWAYLQAFMLSLLVGGRSAFGTARLPVWGQLNTAWDWALKACPVRSEVLCAVCVCVRACACASLCVLEHPCAMSWLNLMNQQCWHQQRFQFDFSLKPLLTFFSN